MDANHLRIEALLGVDPGVRQDLRMRARTSTGEAWAALQSERTPAPGRLNVFKRRAWQRLLDLGKSRVDGWIAGDASERVGPVELEGWLVPVWRGDNDVEEPVVDGWGPAAVLLADRARDASVADELFIDEMLPDAWESGLEQAFRIRWMRQAVLRLVEDRPHLAGVAERDGGFALLQVDVDTLVAVLEVREVATGSTATTEIPGYTHVLVASDDVRAIEGMDGLQARLDALVAE